MNLSLVRPHLVGLARAGAGGRVPESLPALDAAAWDLLLEAAGGHEVAPLVYAGLSASDFAAPPAVREALKQAARTAEVRAARAGDQLALVVSALNGAGLAPALLKGALFAHRCYRSPGLRSFSDLDLLVAPEERDAAAAVLCREGYTRYRDEQGHADTWWDDHHHHWGFVPEGGGLRVELHWALTPPASGVQLPTAALLQRAAAAEVPGGRVLALSLEDELVHLAVHAAKHQFRAPLRQFADVTALLHTLGQPDWPEVRARAAACGAATDTAAYLGVTGVLGLADLPEPVLAALHAALRGRLDLDLLAEYVLEWPWLDRPFAVLEALSQPSLGAAARLFRKALRRGPQPDAPGAPLGGTPPDRGRLLARVRRLAEDAPGVRAQVMIRRQFGGREAPD